MYKSKRLERSLETTKGDAMKINVYGYGFVGKAHCEILQQEHDINIIDPKFSELEQTDFQPEAAIICASTPQHESGACNINNVYEILEKIDKTIPVLIKSTISLEGWYQLKEAFPYHSLNFSPEFLRAEQYLSDFKNMTTMYLSEERATWWAKIFNPFWQNLQFVVGTTEELILVKYFKNAFLATKVSFFNQVYDFCTSAGINYEEVMNGIAQDSRIGFSHTKVTEERGWGGMCLPKDTSALLKTAEKYDVDLSLIREACEYNSKIRKE